MRVGVESLGGVVGMFGGALAGLGGAKLIGLGGLDDLEKVFILSAIGVGITTPLGVYFGGSLMDGQGALLPTYLGEFLGGAVGFGLFTVFDELLDNEGLAFGVLLASFVIGPIVGYELSHASAREDALGVSERPMIIRYGLAF